MLEADADTTNMKLTDVLEKYILDANIIQIMERDYSESL